MRARDNPYRIERLHSLAFRPTGSTWEGLWQRFRELDGRVCVVGPHGSGKTAALQALARFLRKQGLPVHEHILRADEPVRCPESILSNLEPGGVVILDGADLLHPIQWGRIRNAYVGSLIVSSHKRHLLPILYRCGPTPELLGELMRELHPGTSCGQPTSYQLYRRHRGNLRDALLELYDFHALLPDSSLCC